MIQHVHIKRINTNYNIILYAAILYVCEWCGLSVTVSSGQRTSVIICTISSNCYHILTSIIDHREWTQSCSVAMPMMQIERLAATYHTHKDYLFFGQRTGMECLY